MVDLFHWLVDMLLAVGGEIVIHSTGGIDGSMKMGR